MRQGLFPICIVCAVTAASSRKNFDKPSIATEKSFCNSKGVHSSGKQCLRIYKDHFALQNTCWEIPNPFKSAPSRRRLRDGIAEQHKGMLESRCEKNGKADKIPFAVSKNILLRCDCVGVDLLTALTISASPSRTVRKSKHKNAPHHWIVPVMGSTSLYSKFKCAC